MRKGTLPTIAGNPPADAAQPSGINGIIVTVIMNVAHEPSAPRIPNFLFQNKPAGSPDAENRVYPRNKRAVADIWNQYLCLILKSFLIPKEQKYARTKW
jgi:hypothetical protein